MTKFSKTTIMIIVLIVIYVAFLLSTDITKVQNNLNTMNYFYLLISIALMLSVAVVGIIRWHFFLKEIENKVSFRSNIKYYLAGFAFTLSPGRIGEMIRSPYLKRDYGIPISKTASIVFVERFYDLLGITVLLSIGLVFIEFEKSILLIPFTIIALAILIFKNKRFLTYFVRKTSRIKFLSTLNTKFEESYESAEKLLTIKFLVTGTALSTIMFFLQTLAVFYLVVGFSEVITLEQIAVIFPASQFAASISMVPGGIGIFDGGMVGLFVLNGLDYDIAITVTILIRLLSTGLFSVIGIIFLQLISRK